jgi:hypothetical protein
LVAGLRADWRPCRAIVVLLFPPSGRFLPLFLLDPSQGFGHTLAAPLALVRSFPSYP